MWRRRKLSSNARCWRRSSIEGRVSSTRASIPRRILKRCGRSEGDAPILTSYALTFFTGAGAPPPARTDADTSPRISTSGARCGRRRCLLATAALAFVASQVLSTQSPRLLVLNKEDATLAIVDPSSGKILGTVPVGQGPHEVVAS